MDSDNRLPKTTTNIEAPKRTGSTYRRQCSTSNNYFKMIGTVVTFITTDLNLALRRPPNDVEVTTFHSWRIIINTLKDLMHGVARPRVDRLK